MDMGVGAGKYTQFTDVYFVQVPKNRCNPGGYAHLGETRRADLQKYGASRPPKDQGRPRCRARYSSPLIKARRMSRSLYPFSRIRRS
jgi:hypothetical protein